MSFPDLKLPYWAHNIDVYVILDILKPSLIHSKSKEKISRAKINEISKLLFQNQKKEVPKIKMR
jgi:hypothetical protein